VQRVREQCAALAPPEPLPPPRPDSIAAAVLVPIFSAAPGDDGEARLVLTKRPDTMPSHQGQIAFPGGKIDPAVDGSPRDAALREAHEEIGLVPRDIDVIAELPTVGTAVGQFVMTPFVGVAPPAPELVPDPVEVVRVFDVALAELLGDDVYRSEIWEWGDHERTMFFFELDDETIWGATARILVDFLAMLVEVPVLDPW
jgi:8-oxo-dGTP pyrophosphatase MutT (NUDIX family)